MDKGHGGPRKPRGKSVQMPRGRPKDSDQAGCSPLKGPTGRSSPNAFAAVMRKRSLHPQLEPPGVSSVDVARAKLKVAMLVGGKDRGR
jgi:hypothetical protein